MQLVFAVLQSRATVDVSSVNLFIWDAAGKRCSRDYHDSKDYVSTADVYVFSIPRMGPRSHFSVPRGPLDESRGTPINILIAGREMRKDKVLRNFDSLNTALDLLHLPLLRGSWRTRRVGVQTRATPRTTPITVTSMHARACLTSTVSRHGLHGSLGGRGGGCSASTWDGGYPGRPVLFGAFLFAAPRQVCGVPGTRAGPAGRALRCLGTPARPPAHRLRLRRLNLGAHSSRINVH